MTRKETGAQLAFKQESYTIMGACFAVYKDKGGAFREPVYHECLGIEYTSEIFVSFRVVSGQPRSFTGSLCS
ncbi:MAG: GxxExxY protein [Chthoniobacterales bacterium]